MSAFERPEVIALPTSDPLSIPSLARELAQRYLIWDAYVGGQRRVDAHPLVLPAALHEAAVRAAEGVTVAVGRVARMAHEDDAERLVYRLDEDTQHLARASYRAGDEASLVRVDLLLDEQGEWQACEINADCPGGHNEALGLPRLARAAGFMGGHNPTVVTSALAERLATLADGGAVGLIYATAYAEDLQVCAIVQRSLASLGVRAILAPPTAPRMVRRELRVGGEPVRVLYRYFPTEYMRGQNNVGQIAEAVARGRVRSMTSFAHIYAQSKLAFARAWRHASSLGADDREAVTRHTPETFDVRHVSREELVSDRARWVLKKAYGRVGDEVFVGSLIGPESWPGLVGTVLARQASGESWIAQRFVRQSAIGTPWGPMYVTLGAYVLDGRFVGYFARITPESHVSHDALCVPVFHLPRPHRRDAS
jgi:Glutathionylspermidine synthase preATP-grasp